MAKPEYYYGVHAVESLLELEPERVLTLFALKGRDDQRFPPLREGRPEDSHTVPVCRQRRDAERRGRARPCESGGDTH